MMYCCKNEEVLKVPYGNPFKIHLCYKHLVPSEDDGVSFADIDDLVVVLTRFPDMNATVDYELTDEGDIIITLPSGMLAKSLYSLELNGTYNEHPWRWKALPFFRIVDANECGNVQGMETFGAETYYIGDTLDFDVEGNTMTIYTDGHASLNDGVLTIQSSDNTEVDKIKKSLTIQEYGNQ